jgi:hypothetical protein
MPHSFEFDWDFSKFTFGHSYILKEYNDLHCFAIGWFLILWSTSPKPTTKK